MTNIYELFKEDIPVPEDLWGNDLLNVKEIMDKMGVKYD